MNEVSPERPDHHTYNHVSMHPDTLKFYLLAAHFYESLLQSGVQKIESDPDLKEILGEEMIASLPIGEQLQQASYIVQSIKEKIGNNNDSNILNQGYVWGVTVTHGWVRFVKSVALLYLRYLRKKRDEIARRQGFSNSILEAVDQRLSALEEKTTMGIFRDATPYASIVNSLSTPSVPPDATVEESREDIRPRPVVLGSIEIRDLDLRKRCLDLFAQFHRDGQHERLDTVVNEATRILEDRVRSAAFPEGYTGMELAKNAFGTSSPRLVVSDVPAEQEAAHLLFRGVFGFIRNSVHHRLVNNLQPERVLQIVGMIDYLLSLVESARRAPQVMPGAGNGSSLPA